MMVDVNGYKQQVFWQTTLSHKRLFETPTLGTRFFLWLHTNKEAEKLQTISAAAIIDKRRTFLAFMVLGRSCLGFLSMNLHCWTIAKDGSQIAM
ncbi:hypothetical protein TNCV_2123701 [Trichonephila clavipes]|nr:hypothetical protein TNCV_2123701 [Trichonephila clavipes]